MWDESKHFIRQAYETKSYDLRAKSEQKNCFSAFSGLTVTPSEQVDVLSWINECENKTTNDNFLVEKVDEKSIKAGRLGRAFHNLKADRKTPLFLQCKLKGLI